jgi:hypothetical protein
VVADLFGIAPGTAERWGKFANARWSDYLCARRELAVRAGPFMTVFRPLVAAVTLGSLENEEQHVQEGCVGRILEDIGKFLGESLTSTWRGGRFADVGVVPLRQANVRSLPRTQCHFSDASPFVWSLAQRAWQVCDPNGNASV